MDIKTSALIEKIAKLKHRPILFSGYLGSHQGGEKDILRLYPQLDPGRYYVIERKCIVDVLARSRDEHDRVTVLVDASCEIECVSREHVSAADLECPRVCLQPKPKCPCACDTSSGLETVMMKRDELRNHLISVARILVSLGIDNFDCGRWVLSGGPGGAGCCQAYNGLLRDIAAGGNGLFHADGVLAECFGI